MKLTYYPDSGISHSLLNLNDIWIYVDLHCENCGKHQGSPNYFENSSRCIRCGYHDPNITNIAHKLTKIEDLANQLKPFINYNEFEVITIYTQIAFTRLISYIDKYIDKLEYLKLTLT